MLVLDNCTIFDGSSSDLIEGASIEIAEGRIRAIETCGAVSPSMERIDVGGRFVMPGLIDAHVHAYGIEGNPVLVDNMAPGLRALHARRVLEDMLARGFTTVRDAAGGDHVLATGIEKGLIVGPRLFYPGLAVSQRGGHGDPRGPDHYSGCSCGYCGSMTIIADGPDEMRKVVRDQLRQGAHHIKLFVSGGVLSPGDPIWMDQFCEEEIRVAVEEAATRRTYVMAHAHTNSAAIRCIRNGVRSIEHATMLEDDGVEAIVKNGAFAVPTLVVIDAIREHGAAFGLSKSSLDKVEEVARFASSSLDKLWQAGARLGFGTDLMGRVMDQQSHEFTLRRDIMPALDILRSATSINAELLQMKGQLGTIAPGALADIIVIDGNPLEDISILEQHGRIALIMKEGNVRRNLLAH
jgi:imidazolonepropionase-like amidohydrolase